MPDTPGLTEPPPCAGAYEIGAEGERKDREAEAAGAWRDDPADPSERSRETTPAALRMPPD